MHRFSRTQILFGLIAWFLLANALVLWLRPSYLVNILIVYLVPSVVTFMSLNRSRRKVFTFAVVTLVLFAPPVELTARIENVWAVQSSFPQWFGYIPVEDLVYAFFNFFLGISFYELFVDRDLTRKLSKRWNWLVLGYGFFATLVFVLFALDPTLVAFNYWQIAVWILALPASLIFVQNPKLLRKVVLPTLFFTLVFLLHELVSLYLGHWWWPSDYVFSFTVFGTPFPIEDIVIWYFLSTPALIGGYEYFMDDFR